MIKLANPANLMGCLAFLCMLGCAPVDSVDTMDKEDSGLDEKAASVGHTSNNLTPNTQLNLNEYLRSSDGSHRFYLQADGNLVLRRMSDNNALWSSGTHGKSATHLKLQGDGNLVLRTASGAAVWSTKTAGSGATRLYLHSAGQLILYRDSTVVWAVNNSGGNSCPASYKNKELVVESGGTVFSQNGQSLKRRINNLPRGGYKLTVDAASSNGCGALVLNVTRDDGQRWEQRHAITTTSRPYAIDEAWAWESPWTIQVTAKFENCSGKITLGPMKLIRTKRPDTSNQLRIMGVTAYSGTSRQMRDIEGVLHPNFYSLARSAGANAGRISYYPSTPQTFHDEARILQDKGMRIVATLYLEGSFNTWKEAVNTIQARAYSAVQDIIQHGRIPEVILLGNEINSSGPITNFNTWDQPAGYIERYAELLAAGARAMRSAGYTGKIGVHIDRSWSGFFKDLRRFNYSDFQVAAVSSYPKWGDEKTTLTEKIQALHTLATDDNLEILIIETAAPYVNKPDGWATQDFDQDQVVEVSPLGQKMHMQRLLELVLAIPGGKGLGLISWGTDLTVGVHEWDHVTWNRAQIDANFCALPALYAYQEYR